MIVGFHLEMVLCLEPMMMMMMMMKGPPPHTLHSSPTCAHCVPGDIISMKMEKALRSLVAVSNKANLFNNKCVSGGLRLKDINKLEFDQDSHKVFPDLN